MSLSIANNRLFAAARAAEGWFAREWPFALLIGLVAFTRLLWLDADANVFKRSNDIGDEGWWWNAARNRVVLGEWIIPEVSNVWGLWAAPLYATVEAIAFQLGGVSFYTGRLPSALSGVATVALLYVTLRQDYGRGAGLAAAGLLGLNVHFYNYNRLGLVETLRLLLVFTSVIAWVTSRRRPFLGPFLSAVLMVCAFLVKVQPDLVFYPLFLWLFDPAGAAPRWRRPAIFLGTIGLLGLAFAVFLLRNIGIFSPSIQTGLNNAGSAHWGEASYVPFLPYAVLTNTVLTILPVYLLVVLALPALAGDIGQLISAPRQFVRRMKLADAVCWTILLGTLASGLAYDYGDRRMFALTLPLAILAARGAVNRWRTAGLASKLQWDRKRVALCLSALAGLWISWWKVVSTNPWPNFSARWWLDWAMLASAVGLVVLASYFLYSKVRQQDARVLVAALTLSYLFVLTELSATRFAESVLGRQLPLAQASLLSAGFTIACLAAYGISRGQATRLAWGGAMLGVYLVLAVVVIGSQWLHPTFSVRDASRAIGRTVGHGDVMLVETQFDICTETQAKCVFWTTTHYDEVDRLSRDPVLATRRRYWLTAPGRATIAYNPAVSPCLYGSVGDPLARPSWVQGVRLRKSVEVYSLALYELHEPEASECAPR